VKDRLTVPNILTVARMVIALAAGRLALEGRSEATAVIMLIVAALLDIFDGWYARAFAQGSSLGKHLDPLADKVLVAIMYAWIGADAASPWVWWLIGLALARELSVTILRSYSARRHGRLIPASQMGRWKMFLQCSSGLMILSIGHILRHSVPEWAVIAAVGGVLIVSYASAFGYLRDLRLASATSVSTTVRRRENVANNG
jgi:CDP-diacylglycerol--glycerol-3-phosphate 3-phosphatidyltransferase